MAFKLNYFHFICGLSAILIALMYIYPIIFYIFLFVLYSLILIMIGESSNLHCLPSPRSTFNYTSFSVLFVQYNKSKPNVMKPVQASAILYNATRYVSIISESLLSAKYFFLFVLIILAPACLTFPKETKQICQLFSAEP